MATTAEGFQNTLDLLCGLFDVNEHREYKAGVLYRLAGEVPADLCIVELGAYHGLGTIALCRGAGDGHGAPVFTVDRFDISHGWAGEVYLPTDKWVFDENMAITGVDACLLPGDFRAVASKFEGDVGLLFWDAGVRDRMLGDVLAWLPFIVPTGRLLLHDTFLFELGTREVLPLLESQHGFETEWSARGLTLLRKL